MQAGVQVDGCTLELWHKNQYDVMTLKRQDVKLMKGWNGRQRHMAVAATSSMIGALSNRALQRTSGAGALGAGLGRYLRRSRLSAQVVRWRIADVRTVPLKPRPVWAVCVSASMVGPRRGVPEEQ